MIKLKKKKKKDRKRFLVREMSFCVSWVDVAPVEGAAVSSEGQEQQLHPLHTWHGDCVPVAGLEESVSSG